MTALDQIVAEIRACRSCALPHAPRPVVWVHPLARILIAGQAPGRRVHESGIPWNDPSGDRLRDWLQMDRDASYDRRMIAVAAMGFRFLGTVNGADLPPARECVPLWRLRLALLLKKCSPYPPRRNVCAALSSWRRGQADVGGNRRCVARVPRQRHACGGSILAE